MRHSNAAFGPLYTNIGEFCDDLPYHQQHSISIVGVPDILDSNFLCGFNYSRLCPNGLLLIPKASVVLFGTKEYMIYLSECLL